MASHKQLTAISFSHHNTGLDERDALSFHDEECDRFVSACRELWHWEAAVLSTCNRTEFYLYGAGGDEEMWSCVKSVISDVRALSLEAIPQPAIFRDDAAARHVFRVAASLESVALGENEILGQVKDVHQRILEHDGSSPVLDQLFQYAIRVGKRVRTETALCEGILSISSAAVDLATKIFGDFASREILIVGAGQTAEKTAMHFQRSGATQFSVLNRSEDRGRRVAEQLSGVYRPLDELVEACIEADVAVFATGARDHLLDYKQMKRVMKARQHRPIFLIDISNPRNIDPEVTRLGSAFLYNMNDLEQVVEANLESRREQIPAACQIIDHMVEEWERWHDTMQVTPTIASLARFFEQIRSEELDRQYNGISDEKRQMLDDFSRGLVKKLLHNPIMYLRQSVDDDSLRTEDLHIVRSLYNLDSIDENSDEN